MLVQEVEEFGTKLERDLFRDLCIFDKREIQVREAGRPNSPETRRRVLEAVRQLDYYKNAHARRLARGGSDFLGLIISDIENPFFAELVKAFETLVVKRGLNLLLCATKYDPERTEAAVRTMIENKVRGVAVMTPQAGTEVAEELTAHQIPLVFLDLGIVQTYLSNIRVNYSHMRPWIIYWSSVTKTLLLSRAHRRAVRLPSTGMR